VAILLLLCFAGVIGAAGDVVWAGGGASAAAIGMVSKILTGDVMVFD
jgi:hypothetical protein